MARHRIYRCIVKAVRGGSLIEPFTENDFRRVCPSFAEGTYRSFLHKHAVRNAGGNSELFVRVHPGQFKLVRPFKYGI